MLALIHLAAPRACSADELRILQMEQYGYELPRIAKELGVSTRTAKRRVDAVHTTVREYIDRENLKPPSRREIAEAARAAGLV
jgi:hypothetical protein